MVIDPDMLLVQARLLAPPTINYNKGLNSTPRFADWNMKGKNFFEPSQIAHWSCLDLSRHPISKQFFGKLNDALRTCGMGKNIPNPSEFRAPLHGIGDDDRNETSIKKVMEEMGKRKVGIVLVILPFKSAPIYARVKYWADVKYGMI